MGKVTTTLIGNKEVANYKEQELPIYQGNPFIEALPLIFEDDYLDIEFWNIPCIEYNQNLKSKNLRYHQLQEISEFRQPLVQHKAIENKISIALREGYRQRNPILKIYKENELILREAITGKDYTIVEAFDSLNNLTKNPEMFCIFGMSGMGKSTAIERILILYPQLIIHTEYKGQPLNRRQVVWLKIDCPSKGGFKALCKEFFSAIDQVTGERYSLRYRNIARDDADFAMAVATVASIHGLGLLVIDEIQNIAGSKRDKDQLIAFILGMANKVGLPVALVGTVKAKNVFFNDMSFARRFTKNGVVDWPRLGFATEEWNLLLEELWNLQVLKTKVPLDEDISYTIYNRTQGITALVINLFIFAQAQAIYNNKESLSIELINKAADIEFKLVENKLNALRNGESGAVDQFDDLSLDTALEKYQDEDEMKENAKRAREILKSDTFKKSNTIKQLIKDLKSYDVINKLASEEEIISIVTNIYDSYPELKKDELLGKIILEALKVTNGRTKAPVNKKSEKKVKILTGIVEIGAEAKKKKENPYNALKEAGYIKNPYDEFIKYAYL